MIDRIIEGSKLTLGRGRELSRLGGRYPSPTTEETQQEKVKPKARTHSRDNKRPGMTGVRGLGTGGEQGEEYKISSKKQHTIKPQGSRQLL